MTKKTKSDSLKESKVTKDSLAKNLYKMDVQRQLLAEKVSALWTDSYKQEDRLDRLTKLVAALALATAFSTIAIVIRVLAK